MSLYKAGLGAGTEWFPSVAEPLRNQAGEIVAGVRMVRASQEHFYPSGVSGNAPQEQPTGLGPVVDGAVSLISNVAHGMLLLAGVWVTIAAIRRPTP